MDPCGKTDLVEPFVKFKGTCCSCKIMQINNFACVGTVRQFAVIHSEVSHLAVGTWAINYRS